MQGPYPIENSLNSHKNAPRTGSGGPLPSETLRHIAEKRSSGGRDSRGGINGGNGGMSGGNGGNDGVAMNATRGIMMSPLTRVGRLPAVSSNRRTSVKPTAQPLANSHSTGNIVPVPIGGGNANKRGSLRGSNMGSPGQGMTRNQSQNF